MVGVLLAIPAVAGIVSVVFGVLWIANSDQRAESEARYPLRLMTWLMALPGGVAASAGFLFFLLLGVGSGAPGADLITALALPVALLYAVVAAVTIIVLAHGVVSTRRNSKPWLLFGLAVPPILAVLVMSAMSLEYSPGEGFLGLMLAAGATSNALMAVAKARRPATVASAVPIPPPPPTTPPPPPTPPN